MWNSEPRHDWPGGKYTGVQCKICGVHGFAHPKLAPSYCWPHYQEAQAAAAQRQADLEREYGPFSRSQHPDERPLTSLER